MGVKSIFGACDRTGLSGRNAAQDGTDPVSGRPFFLASPSSCLSPISSGIRLWLEAGSRLSCWIMALGILAMVLSARRDDRHSHDHLCECAHRAMKPRRSAVFALERRGFHEAAVVQAFSLDEAEAQVSLAHSPACLLPLFISHREHALAPLLAVIGLFPDPSGAKRRVMQVAIIDYGSGNLHSAQKAFQRMLGERGLVGRDHRLG